MAKIFRAPEPARTALPAGWEWRMYGAKNVATGRCICWSQQAARYVIDSQSGNFRTMADALAAFAA